MKLFDNIPVSNRNFLLVFLLVCASVAAEGQKNRKKKSKSEPLVTVTLSDEKRMELEHYFLEGEKYFLLKDYQKSYTFFERVLEIDPSNAAANYKVAQLFVETREIEKALPYAKRSKILDPDNKYYYVQLANIYTTLVDYDNAIMTYQDLVKNVAGTEQYLFDLAAIQLYQQKYEDALDTYDLAELHLGPMEEIFMQRQQIYLKQNNLDKAISEGIKLVKFSPAEESFVMNVGRIMLSNDKLKEAEKFLNEQIEKNPNSENLFILQAEVYRKQGNPEKALESLKVPFESTTVDVTAKIRTLAGYLAMLPNEDLNAPLLSLAEILVETHPNSYQALAMTGDLYYNIQNFEKGRAMYLKAVKLDGSNFNIWQNIISLDMELKDYDGMIGHTVQALEIFPNQARLYYFNGTAYLIKKDYENAIRAFNIGKAYASRDKNLNSLFHGQLGDAYNGMGEHKKSDAAYELALKAKPDNDHVLNNYSYFLSLRKKDLDKAHAMSSRLVKEYPDSPTYLDTHAWVLYMMEDYEGAVKYLEMAVNYEPSAVIVEHYGDALFQVGKIEEAVAQWKIARDMADDPSNLDKKIADRYLYE